jgi:hypothetical protein
MMSQTKKKRLISSVHMYRGMRSVYLEKICIHTGTSKSKTVKIRRYDSNASTRNNSFFMSNFLGRLTRR